MASLFKVTYSRTDRRTGKVVRRKTKKWYGQFVDPHGEVHRVPLCTDKAAAQALLSEKIKKAERRCAGISDPHEEHRKKPLTQHVEDFRRTLGAKGNTAKHVRITCFRLKAVFKGCRFTSVNDLSASKVSEWLSSKREAGQATKTSNYYLAATKQFVAWLVKDRRLPDNPLSHLQPLNAKVDVRKKRRAATPEELNWLMVAAREGETFRGVSGEDRVMIYLCASYTGFRCSELASLTRQSFDLDSNQPTVTVAARYSKRRRVDVQPIGTELAFHLREWLSRRPGTRGRLWQGSWWNLAAQMLKTDLAAARELWLEQLPKEIDRQECESSDFLRDVDQQGRVLDFHGLRHTFISNLARAGVHPKVAQELARHSTITLTMDCYTHVASGESVKALEGLPKVPSAGGNPSPTSDVDGEKLARRLAQLPVIEGPVVSAPDIDVAADVAEMKTPKPPVDGDLGVNCHPLSSSDSKRRRSESNRRWRICNPSASCRH